MKIIYAHEPLVDLHNSVALLGPTPRSAEVKSWRPKFIKVLKDWNFDGTVLIPEAADGVWKDNYISQVNWELEAIEKAELISFWVPRELPDMPAFTTNVEFGYCLGKEKYTVYGRPDSAVKVSYLDFLHNKYNLNFQYYPYTTIEDTVKAIVKFFV
jgi:hypothetical protein